MLRLSEILPTSNDKEGVSPTDLEEARSNENANSALANARISELGGVPPMMPSTNTSRVPEEHTTVLFLAYLCSRLLESRKEVRACLKIQKQYRKYLNLLHLEEKKLAAQIILSEWRLRRTKYFSRQRRKYKHAVETIEMFFLENKATLQRIQAERLENEYRECAAVIVQSYIRRFLMQKEYREILLQNEAAVCIQSHFRAYEARQLYQLVMLELLAAIFLQAIWRGYVARKAFQSTKLAIIQTQARTRGVLFRKEFQVWITSAVLIQKIWRGFWAQLQHQIDLLDVIAVQTQFRRRQAQRYRFQRLEAVVIIESAVRRLLACNARRQKKLQRDIFNRQNYAALLLQCCFRKYCALHVLEELKQQKTAATLIQSSWRVHSALAVFARKRAAVIKLQATCRRMQARQNFLHMRNSAQVIRLRWYIFSRVLIVRKITRLQSHIRTWLHRSTIQKRVAALVLIQSSFRSFSARRRLLQRKAMIKKVVKCQAYGRRRICVRNFMRAKEGTTIIARQWRLYSKLLACKRDLAATVIQTKWRSFSKSRDFHTTLVRIVSLQAWARSFLGRHQHARVLTNAKKIQAVVRGFVSICSFRKTREAAILIEKHVRAHLHVMLYKRMLMSTVMLQSWTRACIQRRRFEEALCATVRIQSGMRRHAAFLDFARAKEAAISIQTMSRCRRSVIEFRRTRNHLISVQAIIRGYVERRRQYRAHCSAIKMQQQIRCYISIKNFCHNRMAAIAIQTVWRTRHFQKLYQQQISQVVILQALFRRSLAQMGFHNSVSSVVTLQSAFRRYSCVRQFACMKHAVISLQSFFRAHQHSRWYIKTVLQVCSIQRYTRGYLARQLTTTLNAKAIEIQALVRCWLMKKKLEKLQIAATSIQTKWRSCLATSQFGSALLHVKSIQKCVRTFLSRLSNHRVEMVTRIQAAVRRAIKRRQFVCAQQAATLIQATCRGHRTCVTYHETRRSLISLQAFSRGFIARQAMDDQKCLAATVEMLLEYSCDISKLSNSAATMIQSKWRSHRNMKRYKKAKLGVIAFEACVRSVLARQEAAHLRVLRIIRDGAIARSLEISVQQTKAATLLQSRWRAYRDSWAYQQEKIKTVSRVVAIQRRWRGLVGRRRYRAVRANQVFLNKCALVIQSNYRGRLVRQELLHLHLCATFAQMVVRGHLARINFRMDMVDVIISQSIVRRWLANHRLHIERRDYPVILIQKVFRGFISRKTFAEDRKKLAEDRAARMIQKTWRCYVVHVDFVIHQAAMMIQKTWRCYTIHVDFMISLISAITIQNFVRRGLRRKAALKREAAIVIQRNTRGYLARQDIELESFAASEIQRIWRGYCSNMQYLNELISAIKIQSILRMGLAMKRATEARAMRVRMVLCETSAVTIQRTFREYIRRSEMVYAAMIIQEAFRCYLERQVFQKYTRRVVAAQALMRGYSIRIRCRPAVRDAASRIQIATINANANPKLRLAMRTMAAIKVLRRSGVNLAETMRAACTLETATRFSAACCEICTSSGATELLLDLIRTCNRSIPHLQLLHHSIVALANIASHDDLLQHVATSDAIEIFLDLVQMFRDKDKIFRSALDLLQRCIQFDENCAVLCQSRENLKRLKGVHALCSRRLSVGNGRSPVGGGKTYYNKINTRHRAASMKTKKDLEHGVNILQSIIVYLGPHQPHASVL